jgi:hypothetical protein
MLAIFKPCIRCKKRESALNSTRCEFCLDYAKQWQKEHTAKLRANNQCIQCSKPVTKYARCQECNNKKSLQKIDFISLNG